MTSDPSTAPATDISASDAPSISAEIDNEINKPSYAANVPWPVRPTPDINYDFVVLMYLAGSSLAFFFFILERQILAPLLVNQNISDLDQEGNTVEDEDAINNDKSSEGSWGVEQWKEFARGMEGMYVIFVAFVPCLLWSLVVRYYWMKELQLENREKKEN